jgi:hypothetical protein
MLHKNENILEDCIIPIVGIAIVSVIVIAISIIVIKALSMFFIGWGTLVSL